MKRNLFSFVLSLYCILSFAQFNYSTIPAFSDDDNPFAVIEIPAGTNHKIEYDPISNTFPCDSLNGQERIIDFLSYPGNYGFIPSTVMSEDKGGDGDALDVLILSESVATGSLIQIKPIGIILLNDNGEIDNKIIAIPALEENRTINCSGLKELQEKYPAVVRIIENWFGNYKGNGIMEVVGWKDETEAMNEILKWEK